MLYNSLKLAFAVYNGFVKAKENMLPLLCLEWTNKSP